MADAIHEQIKEYYGVTLQSSDDLKTNACCCSSAPPRYVKDVLPLIKDETRNNFMAVGRRFPWDFPDALRWILAAGQEEMCTFFLSLSESGDTCMAWI